MRILYIVILLSAVSLVFNQEKETSPLKVMIIFVESETTSTFLQRIKPFVEGAKTAASVVSPVVAVIQHIMDKTQHKLDAISNKLDITLTKLDGISNQIHQSSKRIISEHDRTIAVLKNERFLDTLASMTSKEENLPIIIGSYKNQTELQNELDIFIREYKNADFESKLVNFLFLGYQGSKPLIDELYSFGKNCENDHFLPRSTHSSTQKYVYDMVEYILMRIAKGFQTLELAINIRKSLSENAPSGDIDYVNNKRNITISTFYDQLRKKKKELNFNAGNNINSFIDLSNAGQNVIKFKNVFQTFLEYEHNISTLNTCKSGCNDYSNVPYSKNGCQGDLRDCKQKNTGADNTEATLIYFTTILFLGAPVNNGRVMSSNYILKQEPQVDRIYEGYNYAKGGWFGKGDQTNPRVEKLTGFGSGYYDCDVCLCICDQKNNINTIRKISTEKISAPEGYVITGVRWAEESGIVFLQVQVGEVLPMGFINPSTNYWMPLKNKNSYVALDYGSYFEMALNHPTLDFGKVLTSVAIQLVDGGYFKRYFIKSWGKSLDLKTGKLSNSEYGSHYAHGIPSKLEIGSYVGHQIDNLNFKLSKNVVIRFNRSDEMIDAGQSFVPYFDASEIIFDKPAPLSGIGLIHYTNHANYSGYIRPVISSLDYRKILEN